jgi:hypothetical protein
MRNWKMFGLWIHGVTIIPCYYDIVKYTKKIGYNLKRKFIYVFPNPK